MTDYDPRIVPLYDVDNPDGPDHELYRGLADRIKARSILDLGCGTGLLTVTLAGRGRTVVGVDPSRHMLDHARARPGAARVEWVLGDSRAIAGSGLDLAVMTGNVAQHIPDPDWQRTLADLRRALADGATLAFESRNPAARAWRSWHRPVPTTRTTAHGPLREWSEAEPPLDGRVRFVSHNVFEATGEHVVQREVLTFRDRHEIERQLERAGFDVVAVWGDWQLTPFDGEHPLMVFEARASR